MKVVIPVNQKYRSTQIAKLFSEVSETSSNDLYQHYVYLLQVTSLDYNVYWDVENDEVHLEVPFAFPAQLNMVCFARDHEIVTMGVKEDALSYILSNIIQDVSVQRVLSHFNAN